MHEAATTRPATDLAQLHADAVLPADVQPGPCSTAASGTVLLTGATGFVGTYLLHTLLRETSADVACLVRPNRCSASSDGAERIYRNLKSHGLWQPEWAER